MAIGRERPGNFAAARPGVRTYDVAEVLPLREATWTAVWAGFFFGVITFMVLSALGTAIFASTAGVHSTGAEVWSFIVGLISLFAGGFVTGRMMGANNRTSAMTNGLLVGAVTIILFKVMVVGMSGTGALAPGMGHAHEMLAPGIIADVTPSYAWGGFVWLVLGMLCAWIGAIAGAPHELEAVEPATTAETY